MKGWQAPAIRKDVRALAPAWLACAVAVAASTVVLRTPVAALLAYVLGAAVMGAFVVGHEYSHRTLASFLALPASRLQQLLLKLGVLVFMLVALSTVALAAGVSGLPALSLPLLCGLCLAPWFTMVGRGPLAGTVFTCAALTLMWVGGDVIGAARYGLLPAQRTDAEGFRTAFVVWGTLALCAAGAAETWRTFMRLEAIDGRSGPVVLPRWLGLRSVALSAPAGVRAAGRPSWIWSLIKKEFHLHQMTVVVAGLYLVVWCGAQWSRHLAPAHGGLPLMPITMLYGCVVAVLVGSFASAEERHLGTSAWQGLLPLASWQQWTVKLAVALALALGLGVGLPLLLAAPMFSFLVPSYEVVPDVQVILVLALTVSSLYISSLSASGMRAVIASLAVLTAGAGLVQAAGGALQSAVFLVAFPVFRHSSWFPHFAQQITVRELLVTTQQRLPFVLFGLLLIEVIWFAMRNHATVERSAKRIARQAVAVVCTIALAAMTMGVVQAATARMRWQYAGTDGVRVSGHAEFEGTTRPTAGAMSFLLVVLETPGHDPAETVPGVFNWDGSFATALTFPGPYLVRVGSTPWRWPWVLKSATYHGRDVAETPLDVSANLDDVVMTFTDHPGTITGQVQGADSWDLWRPVVFLFPVDRAAWNDYGTSSRRVRVVDLDRTGAFATPMPPDGDYYLVAVPRVRVVAILNGTRITLNPGPVFATLAGVADRVQAREGATLTRALAVKLGR